MCRWLDEELIDDHDLVLPQIADDDLVKVSIERSYDIAVNIGCNIFQWCINN